MDLQIIQSYRKLWLNPLSEQRKAGDNDVQLGETDFTGPNVQDVTQC